MLLVKTVNWFCCWLIGAGGGTKPAEYGPDCERSFVRSWKVWKDEKVRNVSCRFVILCLTCSIFLNVVGVSVDVVRVGTPLIPLIPLLLNPPSFTNCKKKISR